MAVTSSFAKFDETVDLAVRLGVDPRHADQMVRGAVVLPNGTGKTNRVLVFAKGEKEREAVEAGADVVGSEDLIEKIKGGWLDFDKAVATPDLMGSVGKIGKILGPRGLMPNAKTGRSPSTWPRPSGRSRPARSNSEWKKTGSSMPRSAGFPSAAIN